jgi:hypothetical protein
MELLAPCDYCIEFKLKMLKIAQPDRGWRCPAAKFRAWGEAGEMIPAFRYPGEHLVSQWENLHIL